MLLGYILSVVPRIVKMEPLELLNKEKINIGFIAYKMKISKSIKMKKNLKTSHFVAFNRRGKYFPSLSRAPRSSHPKRAWID